MYMYVFIYMSTGGHSQIRLDISVQYNKVPFTAFYSVLSGLIKSSLEYESNTPNSNIIPTLDMLVSTGHNEEQPNIHDNSDQNMSYSKTFSNNMRVNKNIPRLKFSTVYVPFIQGRLTVSCHSVRFSPTVLNTRKNPDGTTHRCVLRFIMSTKSYGFTNSFQIPSATNTVIMKLLNQQMNADTYRPPIPSLGSPLGLLPRPGSPISLSRYIFIYIYIYIYICIYDIHFI
jgi:hypothetical protein